LISFADIRGQSLELFKIARTVDFEWVHIGQQNFAVSGQTFTAQTGKGSEIGPNLACFAPPLIFWAGGRPSNFWTGIINLNTLQIIWQNFAEIGPRISKISRWKNFFKNCCKT